jgi:hypothetical protein
LLPCRRTAQVMRVAHDDKMGIPIKSAMEMAAMSSLKHPNIVSTYACLTDMVEERRPAASSSSMTCSASTSSRLLQPLNLRFRKATPSDLTEETRDTYNIVVMERCDRGNL